MKFALATLAAALLVAGCASSHSVASPQSSGPSLSALTENFSNAAMGVSFRYPASWKRLPDQPGDKTGDGVTFEGSTGAVQVLVNYDYSYAYGKAKSPLPFANARPSDLRVLIAQLAPSKIVRSQIVPHGRLRVATMEFLADDPPEAPLPGSVHEILSASAQSGASRSQIRIAVYCAARQWAASRATLLAVLASVRFSTPHVTRSSSAPVVGNSP